MYEHYRTGHTKLGFLNAETTFTLKILAIQPVFVGTALLSIFEPDMGYFFEVKEPFIALKLLQSYFCHLIQAVQTGYLAYVIHCLVGFGVYALGGPVSRSLAARRLCSPSLSQASFLQHVTSITPIKIWRHSPGCCVWGWMRCKALDAARTPEVCGAVYCVAAYCVAVYCVLRRCVSLCANCH